MKWQETIGKTFGDIHVLRRATAEETPWHSHDTPLWVKCTKCGYEWSARKGDVEKEKKCPYCTVKAGRGHVHDITGQQFGYLTAIEKLPNVEPATWKCQCACGNVIYVRLAHLLGRNHSRTISCGCKTRSYGELMTQNTLESIGLQYNIEVIVPECHKWSPFDIEALYPNGKRMCFFECDGEQHFKTVELFHKGVRTLDHQKEIDNIKNLWCKENNIPLFRIPYTDYGDISPEYLKNRFPEFRKLLESLETRQKGNNDFKKSFS